MRLVVFNLALPSQQLLAGCILLALFIGSVVYEVLSLRPDRQWLALLCGAVSAVLVFLLLIWLLG
ncbi:MAG TPA: hypothetical protein VHB98_21880 [Chloroflexota bacterium]|nr:hypothetical protein [Chloroflexota bacterium]